MDLGTVLGLVFAGLVITVVMVLDGGSPMELFAHPQTILLTLGGSIIAASISASLSTLRTLPKLIMQAVRGSEHKPEEAIEILVKMADKARREGLLALENETQAVNDPFLSKGITLVVDGVDPAEVRKILEIEMEHTRERHTKGISLLTAAGGYAPTFGIIGTVMGLITVLQQLDEPGKLGKAIASAFLATLWGLLSANLIWLPLAGKLKTKSEDEMAYRKLLITGILGLQAGENPRLIKDKLNAFLPPKTRETEGEETGVKKAQVEAEA